MRTPQPPEDLDEARWKRPAHLGAADSIQAAGSWAAPLLAGFCFTMTTEILLSDNSDRSMKWPNAALAMFLGAGMLFVFALQSAIWARHWQATPADVEMWHPEGPARLQQHVQRQHLKYNQTWAARTRGFYHLAIVVLLTAVLVGVIPPGEIPIGRIAVIIVAALGVLCEIAWIGSGERREIR